MYFYTKVQNLGIFCIFEPISNWYIIEDQVNVVLFAILS